MDYHTLQMEIELPAATIWLNRPQKRNAITFEMMDELEHALRALAREPGVRGVVIAGREGCFSAGMDLNALKDVITPANFMDYMSRWRQLNEALENHPLPIIAAIEGYCMTGGLELALACDLRVGAEGSRYAITSSKIGTVPGAGGTQRLPRLIGIQNALDLLFSADTIDADRAHQMGLLSRKVGTGVAVESARALIAVYQERAPLSLRFMKQAVYAGMQMPLSDAIKYEAYVVSTIYQSEDKQEGIRSFLEKRAPRFTGK